MNKKQYEYALNELQRMVNVKFPQVPANNLDYAFVGILTPEQMAGHLKTMFPQMNEFLRTNHLSKLDRWLGYAQGFANAAGVFSLNELRKMNMSAGQKFTKK